VGALMGWFKLDDTLTLFDEPLSAFLGYGLTRNTNAYPSALRRLGTFAYPTTSAGAAKVKWASYWEPRGTVLTVDVGINATDFVFNVFYKTTNAAIGGKLYLRHLDSGAQVLVNIAGTASATSVEIPFTTTQPLSGLQGFMVGFQSDVSEDGVGEVEIDGAVGNQVFCTSASGAYPFTLATGYYEMYHLLKIDPGETRPARHGRSLLNYQVCAFRHNVNSERPPHGVLLIWPEIEIQPAILPTDSITSGGDKILADIYELGRLELFSITVEVVRALDQKVLAPLAYQQTTIINGLNNQINASMMELQPDAGSLLTSDGYLGCVLPAGQEATFAFFIQVDDSVQQLLVSFQCVTFNGDQTTSPDITFGVRDAIGNTVGTDITHPTMPVPRVAAKTRTDRRVPGEASFMNGVLAGDEKWGMRDAMDYTDVMMGLPVRFTWGPNVETEIAWGEDGSVDTVYYGVITATADLYIYGFNCKVQ
jgi:hypothetical protein